MTSIRSILILSIAGLFSSGLSRLFKSFPAEPVLSLQSSEVLGRHWLPPFSGFSAGPGSVVFSCVGFRRVGVFAMAPNGPHVVAVALHGPQPAVMGWPTPSEALGKCGLCDFVTNGWPYYLARSELCPYIWAINEQQHAMITATHTEVKGQMGNRIQFAITLSDGRTMTTTAKSEKDAVKTILKHVNASAAPAMTPVQEMCDVIYRTTGVWSMEHTNLIARIHTVAHEQGNDMVDSIAHQLMKTHAISPAQASVLGRFAIANNINL